MAGFEDGVRRETDEARGGSTPHVVRWILGFSLVAAIVLLSAVWMIGAATQGDVEDEANVSNMIQESQERGSRADIEDSAPEGTAADIKTGTTTDGIVSEGADEFDASDGAPTAEPNQPGAASGD